MKARIACVIRVESPDPREQGSKPDEQQMSLERSNWLNRPIHQNKDRNTP